MTCVDVSGDGGDVNWGSVGANGRRTLVWVLWCETCIGVTQQSGKCSGSAVGKGVERRFDKDGVPCTNVRHFN